MAKLNKKGPGRPTVEWTKEKIALLKKLYPTSNNDVVAEKLGKSVYAVRNAAIRFKVKKSERYWDKPEEDWLLKNWPVMSAEELADHLKKTKWSVINKYRELKGLRKK